MNLYWTKVKIVSKYFHFIILFEKTVKKNQNFTLHSILFIKYIFYLITVLEKSFTNFQTKNKKLNKTISLNFYSPKLFQSPK
jgi:hypothetical protein